jgi:hypothetical protein
MEMVFLPVFADIPLANFPNCACLNASPRLRPCFDLSSEVEADNYRQLNAGSIFGQKIGGKK